MQHDPKPAGTPAPDPRHMAPSPQAEKLAAALGGGAITICVIGGPWLMFPITADGVKDAQAVLNNIAKSLRPGRIITPN